MIRGFVGQTEIKNTLAELKEKLNEITSAHYTIRYSSPGGINDPVKSSYSQQYDLWWFFGKKESQYYNPFGIGEIHEGQAVTGKCQINVPKRGLNARLGGAYGVDENGHHIILHNGKFGGGKKGVGKNAFSRFYSGHSVSVDFDGKISEYFIVADLQSPDFFEQLRFFVGQAYLFKNEISGKATEAASTGYFDAALEKGESERRKRYHVPERDVFPGADHARITNELLRTLTERGYTARRNRFMDGFILNKKGQVTHIFEVKSKLNTQTLYTAVGQLMMYGLNHSAIRVFVVGEPLNIALKSDLAKLGIYCVTYTMKKRQPEFGDVAIIDSFKLM